MIRKLLMCVGIVSLFMGTASIVHARHVTNDAAVNGQEALILAQEGVALGQKIASYYQEVLMYYSLGKQGATQMTGLADSVVSKAGEASEMLSLTSISPELADLNFEGAMKSASSMQELIGEKLLPDATKVAEDEITDVQAADMQKLRKVVGADATKDAYASATAFLSDTTKSQEVLSSAGKAASSGEDLNSKLDAANEIATAQLAELSKANDIAAQALKLDAANAMASLPRYWDS